MDDKWNVEINYIMGTKEIDTDIGYIAWKTPYTNLVKSKDYAGSNDASEEDKAKLHVLSPMLKNKRKAVWQEPKLPKGMSQAEYNTLKSRYQFAEGVLNENPDMIDTNESANISSEDARAFG